MYCESSDNTNSNGNVSEEGDENGVKNRNNDNSVGFDNSVGEENSSSSGGGGSTNRIEMKPVDGVNNSAPNKPHCTVGDTAPGEQYHNNHNTQDDNSTNDIEMKDTDAMASNIGIAGDGGGASDKKTSICSNDTEMGDKAKNNNHNNNNQNNNKTVPNQQQQQTQHLPNSIPIANQESSGVVFNNSVGKGNSSSSSSSSITNPQTRFAYTVSSSTATLNDIERKRRGNTNNTDNDDKDDNSASQPSEGGNPEKQEIDDDDAEEEKEEAEETEELQAIEESEEKDETAVSGWSRSTPGNLLLEKDTDSQPTNVPQGDQFFDPPLPFDPMDGMDHLYSGSPHGSPHGSCNRPFSASFNGFNGNTMNNNSNGNNNNSYNQDPSVGRAILQQRPPHHPRNYDNNSNVNEDDPRTDEEHDEEDDGIGTNTTNNNNTNNNGKKPKPIPIDITSSTVVTKPGHYRIDNSVFQITKSHLMRNNKKLAKEVLRKHKKDVAKGKKAYAAQDHLRSALSGNNIEEEMNTFKNRAPQWKFEESHKYQVPMPVISSTPVDDKEVNDCLGYEAQFYVGPSPSALKDVVKNDASSNFFFNRYSSNMTRACNGLMTNSQSITLCFNSNYNRRNDSLSFGPQVFMSHLVNNVHLKPIMLSMLTIWGKVLRFFSVWDGEQSMTMDGMFTGKTRILIGEYLAEIIESLAPFGGAQEVVAKSM